MGKRTGRVVVKEGKMGEEEMGEMGETGERM